MRGPHEFIEDQVERTPDAPALTLGPEQISYLELNSARTDWHIFFVAKASDPRAWSAFVLIVPWIQS